MYVNTISLDLKWDTSTYLKNFVSTLTIFPAETAIELDGSLNLIAFTFNWRSSHNKASLLLKYAIKENNINKVIITNDDYNPGRISLNIGYTQVPGKVKMLGLILPFMTSPSFLTKVEIWISDCALKESGLKL